MIRLHVLEPNPPAGFRPSASRLSRRGGSAPSGTPGKNRSPKRRKSSKMARRSRDRRGRFLKKHGKVRGRKRGRRSANASPRRRKRSHARTSNPPPRKRSRGRRRSSNAHGKVRYRTKHHYSRGRTRNPPYTVKTVAIAVLITGAGFAGAKILPWAIAKVFKKPEWNMGWKAVGLAAGSSLVLALVGYGIGRAVSNKRTAMMIGGEILVGGILATGSEAYAAYKLGAAAGPQPPAAGGMPGLRSAGSAGFSPEQLAQAESARKMLGGMGYFSPDQYARATTGGALMSGFTAEKTF